MSEWVKCQQDGPVTTITLNRPDCGNLITNEMAGEIIAMMEAAQGQRLIVFRGTGKDFCLGRDAAALRAVPLKTALDVRHGNTEPALALYGVFRRVKTPILGVVQGGAIGVGMSLAGACDITLAADDARFQLPEMNHGIPPCLAMSALLNKVPVKAISYLVYSTATVDAQRALMIGLVSEIVPAAKLEQTASDFIKTILTRNPPALPAVKEFLRSAPQMEPQAAADFGSNLLAGVMSSGAAH